MSDKVLKAFNTQTRRFHVGANVTPTDVVDHPAGFDGLEAGGFIGEAARSPETAAAADQALDASA